MKTEILFALKLGFMLEKNRPPGDTHLKKGYGDVRPLRPPFHALSEVPYKTPISACFSSLRPHFQQKSQFFTKLAVLEPKFRKISVPNTQILQNFSSKASNWVKI